MINETKIIQNEIKKYYSLWTNFDKNSAFKRADIWCGDMVNCFIIFILKEKDKEIIKLKTIIKDLRKEQCDSLNLNYDDLKFDE
jgi:hypothetical protein